MLKITAHAYVILHLQNSQEVIQLIHQIGSNIDEVLRSGVAKRRSSARGAKIPYLSLPPRQYLGPKPTLIMPHASALFSYWNGIVLTDFNTSYNVK